MSTPNQESTVSVKVSPATIGCLILLVSFLLPWISFLGTSVPGYQIGKLSSNWLWLWAIPVASGIAIILGLSGKRHIEIAQIAGGLPLVGLAIALYQNGKDLFPALLIGAWATLISGVFLLCVAPRLARKVAAQAPAPASNMSSGDNQ